MPEHASDRTAHPSTQKYSFTASCMTLGPPVPVYVFEYSPKALPYFDVSPSGRVLIVRLVGDEPDGGFTVQFRFTLLKFG